VSPSTGSTEGGTLLTITGQNFDETTTRASVTIGGEYCVVESLSDAEIKCVTPRQQATKSVYPGKYTGCPQNNANVPCLLQGQLGETPLLKSR
jgi:hypothetical protein